jgi:hypothetical protein
MESKLFLTPCETLKLGLRLSNQAKVTPPSTHSLLQGVQPFDSFQIPAPGPSDAGAPSIKPSSTNLSHAAPSVADLLSQLQAPQIPASGSNTAQGAPTLDPLPLLANIRTPHLRLTHLPVIPPLLNWMCAPSHSNSLWHIYLALERIQMS